MRTAQDQALMKALAAEIKARRAALQISQEELAARAEVNRTYVGKIELAMNQPTLVVLLRIAQGLQVDLSEMITAVLRRYAKEQRLPKGS
jgi:transcriptional regulator with XRE-family HTH domain